MARVVSDRGARRVHSVEGTEMLRVALCEGKTRFTSPQIAWRIGHRRNATAREHYRCKFCGRWHLGGASK